jgi:hypothetical protein
MVNRFFQEVRLQKIVGIKEKRPVGFNLLQPQVFGIDYPAILFVNDLK